MKRHHYIRFNRFLSRRIKLNPKYSKEVCDWISDLLNFSKVGKITSMDQIKTLLPIRMDQRAMTRSRSYFHHAALIHYARFLHETGLVKHDNPLKKYLTQKEQQYADSYREWLKERGYCERRIERLIICVRQYFYVHPLDTHPLNRETIVNFQKSYPLRRFEVYGFAKFLEAKGILPFYEKPFHLRAGYTLPQDWIDRFKQFIKDYRNRYHRDWSNSTWSQLTTFGDFLVRNKVTRLENVKRRDITEFLEPYHTKRLTGGYINDIADLIYLFYEWLGEHIDVPIQPVSKKLHRVKNKVHLPRALSDTEVKLLEESLPDTWFRVAFYLGLEAGLRASDTLQMNLKNINLDTKQIRMDNGKGNKDRIGYISPKLEQELRRWLSHRPVVSGCPYLFHNHGKMFTYAAIFESVKAILKPINPLFNFHQLRHTFCTRLYQAGVSLEHRMKLMGHTNPRTTMLYTQVCNSDLQMAFVDAKKKEEENRTAKHNISIELGSIRDLCAGIGPNEQNIMDAIQGSVKA